MYIIILKSHFRADFIKIKNFKKGIYSFLSAWYLNKIPTIHIWYQILKSEVGFFFNSILLFFEKKACTNEWAEYFFSILVKIKFDHINIIFLEIWLVIRIFFQYVMFSIRSIVKRRKFYILLARQCSLLLLLVLNKV